ncbi:MAG TPA: O-acetyl-ADP-ribose deacetylase [Chitinophagales bacterium]|nr:O-acetyl-ADP-ribose deacetylase [Chitinophagales bacterium]
MNRIELLKGDITKLQADAIVNAANSLLMGGGGVDGAIHRAGGKKILDECKEYISKHGRLPTGEAMITSGGNLPAKFVIHTVGPVWNGGRNNEEKLLANAYSNSLKLAAENNLRSVAFPNISTGVYHFPKDRAAKIAVESVFSFLNENASVEKVIFVCFDDENYKIYESALK